MRFLSVFLALVAAQPLMPEPAVGVRNVDPSAEWVYWVVAGPNPQPASEILPRLPLALSGPHRLASGERVALELPPQSKLVGTFLPRQPLPVFTTVLNGGFILADELPQRGTLQINRENFAASNRGRALAAPLQAWNLVPESLVLDGRFTDWTPFPFLVSWGPSFQPRPIPPPETVPRLVSLQAFDDGEYLWIHAVFDRSLAPSNGGSVSLLLKREGSFWEWPLGGQDRRVWLWKQDEEPRSVGFLASSGAEFEARIAWDRMPSAEKASWLSSTARWLVALTRDGQVQTWEWAPFAGGDLP